MFKFDKKIKAKCSLMAFCIPKITGVLVAFDTFLLTIYEL